MKLQLAIPERNGALLPGAKTAWDPWGGYTEARPRFFGLETKSLERKCLDKNFLPIRPNHLR